MPAEARAMTTALRTSISMSCPATGRIWIVTSRATSACHSFAAVRTSMTAPVVSEARKVMMATTATRARPEIVACGTIGVSKRGSGRDEGASGGSSPRGWPVFVVASVVDMQTTLVQHETARVELVHQRDVVGGDDDRSPGFVELDEQPQQPLRQIGIDIARRLVGEEKLRPRDHRPRDRRTLLLSAREHRWQRGDAIAEPNPVQQFDHLLAITVLGLPDHPQRQCHVLEGRHVVEQAEILKHDADAPPQCGQRVLADGSDIVAEQRHQPARGPQREKQQTQKRGLTGARGPGEELERTLIDTERKIAQDLGTEAIAQAHVFEPDHLPLRTKSAPRPAGRRVAPCLDSGLIAARGLFGLRLCCAWARELAMRRRAGFPRILKFPRWPARDPTPHDLRIR